MKVRNLRGKIPNIVVAFLFSLFFFFSFTHTLHAQAPSNPSPSEQQVILELSNVLTALKNLISSLTTKSVAQTADITTGLVGHWKFDEGSGTTASDSSGNNNTGTLTNGPTWTTGKIGSGALNFDGVDDYVNVANESNFDFEHTNAFSVSMWVLSTGTTNGYIVSKVRNGGNFEGWSINNDDVNKRLTVTLTGSTAGQDIIVRTASNTFTTGVWHHIVLTYSGSSNAAGVHVYIDGVDKTLTVSSDDLASSILTNVTTEIGRNRSSAVEFKGSLDEVRVYNRTLSASDVSELYAYTGSGYPTPYTTPPPADTTPPTISNVAVTNVTSSGATVSFTTDEASTAVVSYGPNTTYSSSVNLASGTNHSTNLTSLSANTTYDYRIQATDSNSNVSTYSLGSFTTSATSYTTPAYTTPTSSGNTITATTCSQADVQTAINNAVDGDTVVVPVGTCNWTTNLTISKAITLKGAGIGQTIIRDAHPTDAAILTWTLVANLTSRMTGIEFQNGNVGGQNFNGVISANGSNIDGRRLRVDNNKFDHLHGVALRLSTVMGVIDHNIWLGTPTSRFINVWGSAWDGGVYGDRSWTASANWGSDKFTFIEDNTITYDSGNLYAFVDGFGGSRYVVRYNTITKGSVEGHGTESTQRFRGTRAVEVYNNTFIGDGTGEYLINLRSGTILVHNNNATNFGALPRWALANYRNDKSFTPWGMADGSNQWDLNINGVLSEALDQPCRGLGSLITGDTPILPWPAGQNNQIDEPCYEWNNTINGGDIDFRAERSTIRVGEHFFNDTSAPGYTPYIYPHPLVSGSPTPSYPTPYATPAYTTPTGGNTITAISCNQADVQTALNAAVSGSTVVIPAGTCNWTFGIDWTAPANVTLFGAGDLNTLGGGDATVIVDDYASNDALLEIVGNTSGTLRIAGISFRGGSGSLKEGDGLLRVDGPTTLRLDHLNFTTMSYTNSLARTSKVFVLGARVYGVLDHSILDSAPYIFNGRFGSDRQGNGVWASATNFGSGEFFFMEDNLWRGSTTALPIRIGDGWSGARLVWRFNTIQGGGGFEMHATGHASDDRGVRATEGYGNRFTVLPGQSQPPFTMADLSSGTALFWGNTAETNAVKNVIRFNVTRKNNATYNQNLTPTGWGYCGTSFNGTGSNWDGNTDVTTGYPCLDQPGRGQGNLLAGDMPNKVNSTTGTIAWPNQALEPIYIWNNIGTPAIGWGGSFYADATAGRVVANRDYYPQASGIQTSPSSPFNGSTGTGWGTLARRPTTCTTGVGYWAIDQGGWNESTSNSQGVQQNGGDGELYKCISTNTWTLYYTPYIYPHPLVSGAPAPSYPTPYTIPTYPTPASTTTPVFTKFSVGVRVQANSNVNVRGSASASGNLLGTQSSGSLGTVTSGPSYADSLNWWNINYDSGADGYSAEDFLDVYSVSYITPASTPTYPTPATTPYTPPSNTTPAGGADSGYSTTPTSAPLNITRTLSLGSTGTDVVNLQNYLIKEGYLAIGYNTGYYGSITQRAVEKYQCDKAIVCTGDELTTGFGVVGARTRATLSASSGSSATTTPSTTPSLTETERQALITQIKAQLAILIQQLILMLQEEATQ